MEPACKPATVMSPFVLTHHLACSIFFSFYTKSTSRLSISEVFYARILYGPSKQGHIVICRYWRPEIRVSTGDAKS